MEYKLQRKYIRSEGREIIVRVFNYLKEEYKMMKQINSDNCDLSPLANVRRRTAEATGVSERTVTKFMHQERVLSSSPYARMAHSKKQSKAFKALGLEIDDIEAYVPLPKNEHSALDIMEHDTDVDELEEIKNEKSDPETNIKKELSDQDSDVDCYEKSDVYSEFNIKKEEDNVNDSILGE